MAPSPEQEFNCGDYVTPPEEAFFPERIVDIFAVFTVRNRSVVEDPEYQEELIPVDPYDNAPIPHLPNLHEILREAVGSEELETASEVKLKVIAHEVGLQHLSIHMPVLRELVLDGSVVESLRDLGSGLKMLKVLKVNRCGLTSLDGIYGMKNLSELYAACNSITDLSPCTTLETIRVINVRRNKLRNINSLSFLSVSESLRHLVLEDNRNLTSLPDYRARVKRLLPNLKSLDEVEYPEEDGDCSTGISCSTAEGTNRRVEPRTISRNVSLPPIHASKTSRTMMNKAESVGDGCNTPTSSSTKFTTDTHPATSRLPSARDTQSSSGSGSSTSSRISSARDGSTSSSSANCSYSVSFSPRVLSPRSDDRNESGADIKVDKVELPKI